MARSRRAPSQGTPAGAVVPFYNVSFSDRHPIFWGETEPDPGWIICDGGSDLSGGNVPNLSDRFVMGTTDVSAANETGGSNTTSDTATGGTVGNNTAGGTVGAATLAVSQMPSHSHTYVDFYYPGSTINAALVANSNTTYLTKQTETTGGSGSHTHSFTGASHGHSFTGSTHNHNVKPPYYKLVYCLKLPE